MLSVSYKNFYASFLPLVQIHAEKFKLNPLFILSVAALETGWGKKVKFNNFFGIKASASSKSKFHSFTKELDPQTNKLKKVVQSFRAYSDFNSSCLDFCRLIRVFYPQCIGVFDHTVCALLQSGSKRKYATDPNYVVKLETIYYILFTLNIR
ncbi:MAG: glucosaminidase domain-containing protein [Ignavibacteriaceae bacterium]